MKKLLLDPALILVMMVALFFAYLFSQRLLNYHLSENLLRAENSYEAGLKAKTISERQDFLNDALKIYREIESEFSPQKNGASFYFNYGNTYYQLALYPYAVANYEKANNLMPNDKAVLQNLSLAKFKLGLPEEEKVTIFTFGKYFSQRARFIAFHIFLLFFTLSASWLIWKKSNLIKKLTWLFASAIVLLLLSMAYSYYTTPIQAVVVEPSFLYKGGGEEYAKVSEDPLQAGLKVEVIGSNYNGQWLQVLTPGAEIGYLSQQKIEQVSF